MSRLEEQLTEQFYEWERRGRGWQVFAEPVYPEPPFVPFPGHFLPEEPPLDDGRRPTFLSSLVQRVSNKLAPSTPPPIPEQIEEPEPTPLTRDSLVEFQALLPEKLDVHKEAFEQFLRSISLCREPIAFELLGVHKKVSVQFACHPADAALLGRQLQAFFPEAVFVAHEGDLERSWETAAGEEALAVEFGLKHEFMLPLAGGKLDPFVGIIGALAGLRPSELSLFQVIWQPVHNPWAESIVRSVTHSDGKPFFVNMPELAKASEAKAASPLYAAVVRILVKAEGFDRVLGLAREVAGSLRIFSHPCGNELIPLQNDDYPFEEHVEDALRRQSRRTGMVITSDELLGFVHLPGSIVRSPDLARETGKTKEAPAIVRNANGLLLGTNEHAGKSVPVRLSYEQRVRHCHIIGASGTGKSTLLYNLICQDIQNGEGVAVLDPHGDLIDRILGVIPQDRIQDVILVDPSDEEYSIGFNILSAHSDLEKNLLASDLVAVFERLSSSWGDQMNSVLQNAILAFLESDRGGTIADVRRFLIEPAFRAEYLKSVRDSEVVYYWQKSFPHLTGNKSIGSILTRLDTFLSQKPIRYMVAQKENRLDFAGMMDTGKILLAKLPEGLLGRENSYLLGTLIVAKFQQTAMSRQAKQMQARREFWLYVDEFANFITPSMAEILSGARKYRIGLTLAHQELHQLERNAEVASAVMSHPFTRIVFRVGDTDSRKLGEGFAFFEATDLRNLETGHAICRVERSDFDFNLSVAFPGEPDANDCALRRQEVITVSRKKYGTLRTDVETLLSKSIETETEAPPASMPKAPASPLPQTNKTAEILRPSPTVTPKPAELLTSTSALDEQKTGEPELTTQAPDVTQGKTHSEPAAPRDLGRGGAQHKAIQKRLQHAAQAVGFHSTIEKEIPDGQGSVDLLLERSGETIACEISLTTTIDHEVGNVAKCLKAGFAEVAVICIDEDRLGKIRAAVTGSLGAEVAARVSYATPDQFIARLKPFAPALQKPQGSPTTRRGYKVKRSVSKLSPEEQKRSEEAAIRSIAEAMRRKSK